jgi:glycosyltransferase involved in cell wall biosynthesis
MLALRVDADDWATSFIPDWITRLAPHATQLDVLALEVGRVPDFPANVRVFSMGKERSIARGQILMQFYRHAMRLIPQCDAVFVHMIPRYALLAAPIALPLKKPITLWYTHRHASNDLKLALRLVRRIVTAVDSSFPIQTNKLRAIGHGVDTEFYSPDKQIQREQGLIVHVARLQPIKGQSALIEALASLPDARAVFIGAVPAGEDPDYLNDLKQLAERTGVTDRVTFTGGQTQKQVRNWYRRAAVAVNLSPPGLFDKAALESMLCETPTLVSNPAFDNLLVEPYCQLHAPYPLPLDQLITQLDTLLNLPHDDVSRIGTMLRQNVVKEHGIEHLIPRLAAVILTGEVDVG